MATRCAYDFWAFWAVKTSILGVQGEGKGHHTASHFYFYYLLPNKAFVSFEKKAKDSEPGSEETVLFIKYISIRAHVIYCKPQEAIILL